MNTLQLEEKSFDERVELEIEFLKGDYKEAVSLAWLYGFIKKDFFEEYWEDIYWNRAQNEYLHDILEVIGEEYERFGEDALRTKYYNMLLHNGDDAIDEYRYQHGEEHFDRICEENNLVEISDLAKFLVDKNDDEWYNNGINN